MKSRGRADRVKGNGGCGEVVLGSENKLLQTGLGDAELASTIKGKNLDDTDGRDHDRSPIS